MFDLGGADDESESNAGGVYISFNSRSRYSEYGVSGGGEPCVSESP